MSSVNCCSLCRSGCRLETRSARVHQWRLSDAERSHILLAAYRDSPSGRLSTPCYCHHWLTSTSRSRCRLSPTVSVVACQSINCLRSCTLSLCVAYSVCTGASLSRRISDCQNIINSMQTNLNLTSFCGALYLLNVINWFDTYFAQTTKSNLQEHCNVHHGTTLAELMTSTATLSQIIYLQYINTPEETFNCWMIIMNEWLHNVT